MLDSLDSIVTQFSLSGDSGTLTLREMVQLAQEARRFDLRAALELIALPLLSSLADEQQVESHRF